MYYFRWLNHFTCLLLATRLLIVASVMSHKAVTRITRVAAREKMSAVWEFFVVKKEDTRLAICNSCKCEIMRGGSRTNNFNTTNLISHLKFRHPEMYKDYQTKVTSEQTTLPTTNKPVQQILDNTKTFDKDSAKAKAITYKVMEMIAIDDQPFSIVKVLGFRRLIEFIEPCYSLPSRRYFADVSLPALYNEAAAHIHMVLGKNVTDISFTTDIWSIFQCVHGALLKMQ